MDQSHDSEFINNILDKIFSEGSQSEKFSVMKLKKVWVSIVGEKLAEYTEPYGAWNKILYINCSHQGWVQTLQFHKERILQSIADNKTIDLDVEDVRFKFVPKN